MPRRPIALIPLLVLTALLTACGSTRSIDLADPTASPRVDVEPGDAVTVIMHDGERHTGSVVAVTEDSLTVASNQYRDQIETRVALAEVATIEVKGHSPAAGIAIGLMVGVGLIIGYLALVAANWQSMS